MYMSSVSKLIERYNIMSVRCRNSIKRSGEVEEEREKRRDKLLFVVFFFFNDTATTENYTE